MYKTLSKKDGLFSVADWELLGKYMGSSAGGEIKFTADGTPFYKTESGIIQPVFYVAEADTIRQHMALTLQFQAKSHQKSDTVWEGTAVLDTAEPFLPEQVVARIEVENVEGYPLDVMQRLVDVCAVLEMLKTLDMILAQAWVDSEYNEAYEKRLLKQLITWLVGMGRMSRFSEIGELFSKVNLEKMPIARVAAMLRTTYSIKIYVPEWVVLLEKAKLKAIELDQMSYLDGL